MPITSQIEDERPGNGFGRGNEQGNGKALGLQKQQERAMADGEYTIIVDGVNADNASSTSQTSAPTTLFDGTVLTTEVRQGSVSVADAPDGHSDDEALRLETDNGNGRLRLNLGFDADQQVKLGDLETLSFDYYIETLDRTDVTPVIRLIIDADGDLSTTNDRGELVFEYAYQGLPAAPQDSWQSVDALDWNAWQRSNGANRDTFPNIVEFSEWADADGFTPAGGIKFDEDSVVLGASIAFGSGNGTGVVYLDNLQINGVTYDFG